jgi:hypothetical protein
MAAAYAVMKMAVADEYADDPDLPSPILDFDFAATQDITATLTVKGVHQFDWDATAEEFHDLCDRMEELAAEEGHDPRDIAAVAIHTTAVNGADNDPVKQRGQAMWIVYAVLHHTAENIDVAKMVDHAGVIAGPPTMFDLAAHQHIKATIRVRDNMITMELAGRSPLDS